MRETSGEVMRKSAAKRLTLMSVRGYQIFLGPVFGGGCKFEPSCSRYTYEAIERFGARRGVWLGLKRFLRCRPFSTSGYDPVPTAWPDDDRRNEKHFAEFKGSNRFPACGRQARRVAPPFAKNAQCERDDNAIGSRMPAKARTQAPNRRDRAEAAN